ncbi:phosphatase PAP2 family protein [Plesiomonas sp.]|uniref:phosphatase PAP2 family protein n=1 Tax=Plesiomonas sp. TaxID=2486279 RepID=UPI003F32A96F
MVRLSLRRFDLAVSTFCLCHRFNHAVARVSRMVSRTGDGPLYLLVGVLLYYTEPHAGTHFFRTGCLAFAVELPVYWLLKNSIRRNRPLNLPCFIVPSDRYSLPSGHTAAAFLMTGLVAAYYPFWLPIALSWALLIGLSRVLLGVHFLTDIIAGALLGLGCATLALEWA